MFCVAEFFITMVADMQGPFSCALPTSEYETPSRIVIARARAGVFVLSRSCKTLTEPLR